MADIKEAIEKVLKDSPSGKKDPLSSFELKYDAPSAHLESIYFWILDFVQDFGYEVQKTTDNFTSSPGSGHFGEMGTKATRMQEEGIKILGAVNQVIKAVLNLLYDLKEFEIRLQHYKDAKSEDKGKKEAGMLALKQIWLDQVDLKRGRGSIHQMSAELGYTTLREAFMIVNSQNDIKKMTGKDGTINEQVKRILQPRLQEFLNWKEKSERELEKRFEIERSYLKTQVETIKLYSSWVKPYIKAAEQLKQKGFENNPALVNAFNTAMFELVLFCKKKEKPPAKFGDYKLKRDYFSTIIISLKFRGFPQKVTQQHYGFGGRVEITFDSYSINADELKFIEKEKEDDDLGELLKFSEQTTENSLEQLREDIEHFLNDDYKKPEKKEEKKKDDVNPFSALFGLFKINKDKKEKKEEVKEVKKIKKDNFIEDETRKSAEESAKGALYKIYDIYKKSHGMASAPGEGFDN